MTHSAHRLQLRFDPGQFHQLHAIQATVDLFDGFPKADQRFTLAEEAVSNLPEDELLDDYLLAENLQRIRQRNRDEMIGAPVDDVPLEVEEGRGLEGVTLDSFRVPNFTIEMETGTGKTYVYLRTMRELVREHGFRKFVIVVPSVAIFEGVKKTFEVTKDHLAGLYGNDPVALIEYDGGHLGRLRDFASNQFLSILLITRDAFNKASNKIFQASDQLPGELLPFEYVQKTRSFVILDEPQNMSSDKSREAIRTLNPLCVFRYSATHRETPNLLYRLTPVDAFRLGLVKQIEVVGVSELDLTDVHRIRLLDIVRKNGAPITARVRVLTLENGVAEPRNLTLGQNDDLFAKTGVEAFQGLRVENIKVGKGKQPNEVDFTDGSVLTSEDDLGSREAIFRAQIERTIETHMRRQENLAKFGVKVLSLFFIDAVDNYVQPDGVVKKLFDESFNGIKKRYAHFRDKDAAEVREAYFAARRDKKTGVVVEHYNKVTTQKEKEAAKDAFGLIMRDKERLLSFEEPVSFVFAHSALKEGWDNPNIFQICTLNQTVSEVKKRQEVGRGLRLCVDQTGERKTDFPHNVLTVVANESYEQFVDTLQREYVEDGVQAPPKPKRATMGDAKRREDLFRSEAFRDFWAKLQKRLRYRIDIDSDELTRSCVEKLNATTFPEPRLQIARGRFVMTEIRIGVVATDSEGATVAFERQSTDGRNESGRFRLEIGNDLGKVGLQDLRGIKLSKTGERYGEPWIVFSDGEEATASQQALYRPKAAKAASERDRVMVTENRPVPDVIGRAADATHLTRATILRIFGGLKDSQKAKLLKNPEGWTNTFVRTIDGELADHVAERIVFEESYDGGLDAELLFPDVDPKPQHELVAGGPRSLYDLVQIDSDVERTFVTETLGADEDGVLLYFKFPPRFKILLPKVLGNYNPDWAIVREGPDGFRLELIRETKGAMDVEKLRFDHEKRKIRAAERYFAKLGIDYRVVTGDTVDYWQPAPTPATPLFGD